MDAPDHLVARTDLVLLIRRTVLRGYAGLQSLRPCWATFLSTCDSVLNMPMRGYEFSTVTRLSRENPLPRTLHEIRFTLNGFSLLPPDSEYSVSLDLPQRGETGWQRFCPVGDLADR